MRNESYPESRNIFTYETNGESEEELAKIIAKGLEGQEFAVAPTLNGSYPEEMPVKASKEGEAVTVVENGSGELAFLYTNGENEMDEDSMKKYLNDALS